MPNLSRFSNSKYSITEISLSSVLSMKCPETMRIMNKQNRSLAFTALGVSWLHARALQHVLVRKRWILLEDLKRNVVRLTSMRQGSPSHVDNNVLIRTHVEVTSSLHYESPLTWTKERQEVTSDLPYRSVEIPGH
jgi:hypothetical protein